MNHPIQPLETKDGILQFKENAIVRHLMEFAAEHGCDLNRIACMDFSNDDRRQFAQLIGYSLSGYGSLSYVDDDSFQTASLMAEGRSENSAKIEHLEGELKEMRNALRGPMARLFGVHPDDLTKNG